MSTVLVEGGPVTTLTLNRPEKHNAIDTEMGNALISALEDAGADPAVKVVVLKGAGKSFCAGDDMSEGGRYRNRDVEPAATERLPYYRLMPLIRRIPKPVVAQVHGHCIASGVDLLLAADFAVADADARIHVLFGARGIGPTGAVFLPRYLGLKRTNELLFRADPISAEEALVLGLVTTVAAPGTIDDEVAILTGRLCETGERDYAYFGLMKDLVNHALFPSIEEDVRLSVAYSRLNDFYRQTRRP